VSDQTASGYEPAFLDDEGPSDPPAHVCTLRMRDVLAARPGELADQESERRRVRMLTADERAELRQNMAEASAWMRAELARRRSMNK
jgi:hypothetical protein